jgi:hypothetical protein
MRQEVNMPESEIKARGGAKRWRTITLEDGRIVHVAIVPKAGPRGGHTVAGPARTPKNASKRSST